MENEKSDKAAQAVHIELRRLIDHNHPLAQLCESINWDSLELAFRAPKDSRFPTRLMLALQYLRQTYELGDREVIEKTKKSPYYQYFCGLKYFNPALKISEANMREWRAKFGSAWSAEMLVAAVDSEARPEMLEEAMLGHKPAIMAGS